MKRKIMKKLMLSLGLLFLTGSNLVYSAANRQQVLPAVEIQSLVESIKKANTFEDAFRIILSSENPEELKQNRTIQDALYWILVNKDVFPCYSSKDSQQSITKIKLLKEKLQTYGLPKEFEDYCDNAIGLLSK